MIGEAASDMGSAKDDAQIRRLFAPDMVQVCRAEAPVSEWTIRAWCRVMGDRNPVYQDHDAAVRHGHGGVFAPPIMMHAYTLPGLIDETQDNIQRAFRRRLAELGITSVAAVNYSQEYVTPIRLGDVLTREVRLASISDAKTTALGVGHFVDLAERVTNQDGALIGNQSVRVLFFRPGERREQPRPAAAKPVAPAPDDTMPIELPPLAIPITTTLIVAGALATNDFEQVHHDRDVANAQGMQDIFMNILTSSALAMRFVTDWTGPAAKVRKLSTRLNAPNFPGDTMTITGRADRPYVPGTETVVQVRGTNSLGTHIDCSLTVE